MAEDQQSGNAPKPEETSTMVTVPDHLIEQVIEFVNNLSGGEDVSGHALRTVAFGGMRGTLAAKGWTGTECTTVKTAFGTDQNVTCSDTDEVVLK